VKIVGDDKYPRSAQSRDCG